MQVAIAHAAEERGEPCTEAPDDERRFSCPRLSRTALRNVVDEDEVPPVARCVHSTGCACAIPVGNRRGRASASRRGVHECTTNTVQKCPRCGVPKAISRRESARRDRLSIDVEVPDGREPVCQPDLRATQGSVRRDAEAVAIDTTAHPPAVGESRAGTARTPFLEPDTKDKRGRLLLVVAAGGRGMGMCKSAREGADECCFCVHLMIRRQPSKIAFGADLRRGFTPRSAVSSTRIAVRSASRSDAPSARSPSTLRPSLLASRPTARRRGVTE